MKSVFAVTFLIYETIILTFNFEISIFEDQIMKAHYIFQLQGKLVLFELKF